MLKRYLAPIPRDMELIGERRGIGWLPEGAVARTYRTDVAPQEELTTSAYVLLFRGEDLLLIKDRDRGWDIPGGHREKGETIEACATRELYEEGAAKASKLVPFALVEVELTQKPPLGYQYPSPKSYMIFYVGFLDTLLPFAGEFETEDRKFISPKEALNFSWIQSHRYLYEPALAFAQRAAKLNS